MLAASHIAPPSPGAADVTIVVTAVVMEQDNDTFVTAAHSKKTKRNDVKKLIV